MKTVSMCLAGESGLVSFLSRAVRSARSLILAGLATAILLPTAMIVPAQAQVIGAAEIVENRVLGDINGVRRELAPEASVHRNELIRTEAASSTRLRFVDRTDLRMGPSAQLRLDSNVFSGQSGTAVTLSRGAMRFVSGAGPAGSYQIRTPVATIGLRGTTVDVVLRQGRAFVTLLDGAAQVCAGRSCTELTNRCDYVEAGGGRTSPARPLAANIPTFTTACRGAACGGGGGCTASAAGPGRGPGGYDPAGGANFGGGGGNAGGGGGQGR